MITKDQLFTAATVKEYEIPGLPEKVLIRTSKHAEVSAWMEDDNGDALAVAASVVDTEGNPMMTPDEARENLDSAVFRNLVDAALKANGYDLERLKNLKNLSTPSKS